MNHALAREIYGAVPWHMDANSYVILQNILRDARNATSFPDVKSNSTFLPEFSSDSRVITRPYGNREYPGQLDNNEDFEAVGVINIDGVITNSGGASHYGMMELSSLMRKMSTDSRVKGFVLLGNSGGGSSIAVETIGETITEVRKTKRVISLIKKGGTSASAMYMIHSYGEKIFAESEMSVVGSNGTMVEFSGIPANSEIDGEKHIRLYATKSIKKNEAFEEAINNDNYTVIINEMLDPINERALSKVLENRPQLAGSGFETGKAVFAKDGVGTYIDGFASFSEVVEMILNPQENNIKSNTNSNNNNIMTVEELKSKHPAVYNEIHNSGVESERDRVGAWMAHLDTDSKAVTEGISSGKEITNSVREVFFVKSNAKKGVQDLASSSPAAIVVDSENEDTDDAENKALEQVREDIKNSFKGL